MEGGDHEAKGAGLSRIGGRVFRERPGMPGCHSQGETLAEAFENVREAAQLWLEIATDTAAAEAVRANTGAELQEIDL